MISSMPKKIHQHGRNPDDRDISKFISNTGMSGITHSILLGSKTNLKSAVGLSYNTISYNEKYIEDDYSLSEEYRAKYDTRKWTVSSTLNHRFNNKHNIRIGAIANFIRFSYNQVFKRKPQCAIGRNDQYKRYYTIVAIICSMAIQTYQ